QLLQTNDKEAFLNKYIDFILDHLSIYFDQLRQNGIDRVLLTTINRGDQEESATEKLQQIRQLIIALARLNDVFEARNQAEHRLSTELETWKLRAQKMEKEVEDGQSQLAVFRADHERKLHSQQI